MRSLRLGKEKRYTLLHRLVFNFKRILSKELGGRSVHIHAYRSRKETYGPDIYEKIYKF